MAYEGTTRVCFMIPDDALEGCATVRKMCDPLHLTEDEPWDTVSLGC